MTCRSQDRGDVQSNKVSLESDLRPSERRAFDASPILSPLQPHNTTTPSTSPQSRYHASLSSSRIVLWAIFFTFGLLLACLRPFVPPRHQRCPDGRCKSQQSDFARYHSSISSASSCPLWLFSSPQSKNVHFSLSNASPGHRTQGIQAKCELCRPYLISNPRMLRHPGCARQGLTSASRLACPSSMSVQNRV